MIVYPEINPVFIEIGPLKVHWYGMMYLFGFLSAWLLAKVRVKRLSLPWNNEEISELIFYGAIGVVVGGRVGSMLFYGWHQWLHEPLAIFKVWQGGMSFHGGLLGVAGAMCLFSKRYNNHIGYVFDFLVPLVPLGLAAGRIGNFINGELWGRVTTVSWGMVFPHVDNLPRHPSQLYEFALEGCLLFVLLWSYCLKPRPRYAASGAFLILYGVFRIISECFRQPDAPLGFIAFNWLTMGQLLSLPMIILGGVFMFFAYRHSSQHDDVSVSGSL
jgi:phosphatidylglycerol:prolipoprotein diacylglycerol transferase